MSVHHSLSLLSPCLWGKCLKSWRKNNKYVFCVSSFETVSARLKVCVKAGWILCDDFSVQTFAVITTCEQLIYCWPLEMNKIRCRTLWVCGEMMLGLSRDARADESASDANRSTPLLAPLPNSQRNVILKHFFLRQTMGGLPDKHLVWGDSMLNCLNRFTYIILMASYEHWPSRHSCTLQFGLNKRAGVMWCVDGLGRVRANDDIIARCRERERERRP